MTTTGAIEGRLLELQCVTKTFNSGKKNEVKAVDNISFSIYKGETFGLVGESGCGKSTTGRMIAGLFAPTGGSIIFDDEHIGNLKEKKSLMRFRRRVQMIFQDPYASLDPRMKVREIIAEGIKLHKLVKSKSELDLRVEELLLQVGLDSSCSGRYPHEFSGGQRQRIGIARALAVEPEFIVCDEPISALDVSIQAQVINLLLDLRESRSLTYLFIAHDLTVVRRVSDRIGVMYKGKLVEIGDSDEIYHFGVHPYTESLLSAIPIADPVYAQNHKRKTYSPPIEECGNDAALREIAKNHSIYCTESEIGFYREKLLNKKLKS